MAQIAEHNSEQEGESDDGVKGWISFLVRSNTISIDQSLEAMREFIRAIESRWIFT